MSLPRRAVAGWVLYDLANTIFSFTIISNYFPVWVVDDMGGRDSDVGIAESLAMAMMLVTAPLLGALSDQMPRRMPFLVASTAGCCGLTLFLGSGGLTTSLVLFVGANYLFQAGLIFYDALLPTVSTEDNRGRIGGLGVGIGYVGALLGVVVGRTVESLGGGKPLVFRLTAVMFLLFAVPCFVWVRERPRPGAGRLDPAARGAVADLRETLRRLRRYPSLARFLAGRVFYTDAANTLILFMAVYATQEIGFSDVQKDFLLLIGTLGAIAGGLAWGRVVDRIGPKRALLRVLGLWTVTLALTAAVGLVGLPKVVFWPVAVLAGLSLGGTWAADRPLMLRLAPPRHLGQFYGLYAMAGRFAAILGPLAWALVVDGLDWGRPAAVLSLLVMVGIAALVLRPVNDAPRAWEPEEQVPS